MKIHFIMQNPGIIFLMPNVATSPVILRSNVTQASSCKIHSHQNTKCKGELYTKNGG